MTGPLGLGNGRLWDVGRPTLDTNGANKKYVDDQDTALKALWVLKASSTMSGVLSMDNNKITSLETPTDDKDASAKSMWMTKITYKYQNLGTQCLVS